MNTPEAPGRKVVVFCTKSPYGSSLARESLDYCLAAAAFDQNLEIIYTGEAVLQLLKNQNANEIQHNNLSKTLAALPIYGVDKVYVDAKSLYQYGIAENDICLPFEPLNNEQIAAMIASANLILNF